MKNFLRIVAIATLVSFMSCTKDKEDELDVKGKNTVAIEFDHGFDGEAFGLGKEYRSNGDEKITPDALDYIVGNFVLTNDKGEKVSSKGFYIISEGGEGKVKNLKLDLKDIPAGNYTKVKFGIGVDPETYKNETAKYVADGNKASGIDLWVVAKKYGLIWNWTAGYKNLAFEGTFSDATNTSVAYKVHIANDNLYQEIELSLKNVVVAEKNSPQIHIKVDAGKILGGANKIKLSEGSSIMGDSKTSAGLIRDNFLDGMFTVDHSHNSGSHH